MVVTAEILEVTAKEHVDPLVRNAPGGPLLQGANNTSVDAFVIADAGAELRAYLMEWKYVEEYEDARYKGVGNAGRTRRRRYATRYAAESSSFSRKVPMDEHLYEPFYQFLRLCLLADRMVADGELGVTEAKVVAVVPGDNSAYWEQITSAALAARFLRLGIVFEVMRATLKHADRAFASICISLLREAVERERGTAASSWAAYQRERYG